MPELPEVETVRRGLEKLILGKKISSLEIRYPKMIKTDLDEFRKEVPDQVIESIGRRGKYLLFYLTDKVLISHLRMEGKYFYYPDQVPERKHAHILIRFEDSGTLVYEDVRKFGTMELLAPDLLDAYFISKKLGPEPGEQDFDLQVFQAALSKSKKPIKSHLLDQTLVAGLGNIYVDEVLWRAQVHPARPSQTLTAEEATAIHDQTIAVLGQAVEKGGSTIRTYTNAFGEDGTMQDFHQVYDKTGQACSRCGGLMGKIIGITGGIASGKSTVTNFLREKGFQVVDADAVVHQLQKPGGRLYQLLVQHFGQKIILENKELNRPLLASLIFSNPEEREWSKQTQGEIIREELAALRDQLAQTETVFFMDIPLLFEQDYSAWFDETWLVYVDRDVQVERFMKRDHLSKEVAESRLAAQWSLEEKKKLASHILDNNGSRDQLVAQVVKLLEGGDSCARD